MTRKRFEKLMISKNRSQARDIRQSICSLIQMRHYSETHKGILMVYDEKNECFMEAKMYPYSEMLARIERGEKAIGH